VKAFILSICLAVVFAILLVSANTMAMSIRERTREVALLKTLGFTQGRVLGLFVGEAMAMSILGGVVGTIIAVGVIRAASKAPGLNFFLGGVHVGIPTMLVALLVAAAVGFVSAFLPAYHASRGNIVEGLRHIG
jgi:putative ABC transport system permease protein